ncbi:hemicentin-1-like isoform X1 [Trachinotus anak]|uniref:hemicentin-1-like isoform X1 n=1 Tax=Trachinotus anak TaxID=443729 RepID=UPI0039F224EC
MDLNQRTTGLRFATYLLMGIFLWTETPAKGDTEVSCVFMESCILPCSFQGGTDVVVHWTVTAGDLPVHSYYHNQDQLAHQDQRFRGRTSLFKDQISRGNASLQLTGVEVQDQGRYRCFTSTIRGNKDSFINLRVDAPVGEVDLQQVENNITCSSEGIYPEPELNWSTSPPSNVTFKNKTEVQRTEQLLYNISSSLILSDTDLNFICSISTRSNRRRATLFKPNIEVSCVFMESCILPCSFQGDTDVVVHWLQLTAGHLCVHSYFKNQDQLAHQDKRFRGRTSLFKDQISRGNTSLQLTGVEVQDQGRYRCFTSTNRGNKDSLINLRVDAPVGKVDLQQVENNITCSSEGIYPEPELTWSTSPPSNVTFKNKTEVQRTEQLLYSISSSLILSDTDLNYICSISTRSNRRRATLFKPNTEVSCVFMESCILPCSFQGGTDVVVHWNQVTAGDLPVHFFFDNQDQLTHQDQRFRGRTSLFKDQISRGNASLLLTGVEVQDQGRYQCFTSTIREDKYSYINLKEDAPVGEVDLRQVENRITCSSEGIYPEPELTWSTSPPSYVTFKNKTEVQRTEQLLYNISSSLILSDTDLNYICSISTRSNRRRATLFQPTSLSVSHTEATIPCTASNTSLAGSSLTWRFKHSQIILTQTRDDVPYTVSEEWRQQLKGVSESGSLLLQDLSSYHEGIYTCELRDAEETLITNTFLRIEKSPENSTHIGAIIGVVVAVIVGAAAAAAAVVALVLYCKKKKGHRGNNNTGSNKDETQEYISSLAPWTVVFMQRMTRVSCDLTSLLLSVLLWTLARGNTEVSCVFMESCILPCSFQGGTDVVVHWTVTAGDLRVHSYYHNQDQLAHQDQRFRGRTSLFKDQISRGNASLQLTGVEVQDQGRYRCYTSIIRGNKDSLINLRVDAPVGKVDLQQVENNITCSSEGIYPEPELTWSTSPPSNVTFKSKTEVQRTEQLLYSISSSLILSDTDLNYICSISTRSNRRRATLFKPTSLSVSHTEATIPCTASNTSLTGSSLTWRFKHSQIILTQTRADVPCTVSEEWRQQVKGVSESGSLLLQDLSAYHEGIYTCELRDAEETLITSTFLRIGNSVNIGAIIGGVVAVIAGAAAVVLLVLCCKKKKGQQGNNNRESNSDDSQRYISSLAPWTVVFMQDTGYTEDDQGQL